MKIYKNHLIHSNSKVKEALYLLNELSIDAILFVIDKNEKLIGSLTDGDIRRGLIDGYNIESNINDFIEKNPKYISKKVNSLEKIIEYRKLGYKILPVLDENRKVVNIINFRKTLSYLPVDAVIMAGGKGKRLSPLTDSKPKPLLLVGNKPIIEHNLDRLALFGIDDIWISINYLGEQIESYFGDGKNKNLKIEYVWEKKSLGTIGAVSKIKNFKHDNILLTNSDLLTNLNYEHFYKEFLIQDADMAVLSIPYKIDIPYAVLESNDSQVKSFIEKPTYTYYSNGGVYLFKKSMLKYIPENKFFNATDFMQKLLDENYKVVSIPFSGYWLDVGKHDDFKKANEDIKNFNF